jgi:hypothetical protein
MAAIRSAQLTRGRAAINLPHMITARTSQQQKRRSLAAYARADQA